jgi:Domain of unknown function (DUF4189)
MMTTTPTITRRRRIAAATLLAAAGAMTAIGVGAAAPANAEPDKYVAISFSPENGAYGWGNSYNDLDGARIRSLTECQNFGGTHCVFIAWAKNWCAALAVGDRNPYGGYDQYYGWYGPTQADAEQQALAKNNGGRILVSRCATGTAGTG